MITKESLRHDIKYIGNAIKMIKKIHPCADISAIQDTLSDMIKKINLSDLPECEDPVEAQKRLDRARNLLTSKRL